MIENKLGIQPSLREELDPIQDLTSTLTLPMPVIADLAGGATTADTVTKVNALLAALRTARLLKTV